MTAELEIIESQRAQITDLKAALAELREECIELRDAKAALVAFVEKILAVMREIDNPGDLTYSLCGEAAELIAKHRG